MNLRLFLLSVAAFIASGLTVEPAAARDYYVRQSGRDSNDGRTAQSAFVTLGRVFQETLVAGDVVYVGGGVYEIEQTITAGSGNTQNLLNNRNRDDEHDGEDRSGRNSDRDEEDRNGDSRGSNRDDDRSRGSSRNGDDDRGSRGREGSSNSSGRGSSSQRESSQRGSSSGRNENGASSERNSGRGRGGQSNSNSDHSSNRSSPDGDGRGSGRNSGRNSDDDRGSSSRSGSSSRKADSRSGNTGRESRSRSGSRNSSSPNRGSSSANGGSGLQSDTQANADAVTLIGDASGRFTGDRGRVVLSPQADGWCLALQNIGNVTFDGFNFETSSRARRLGNGISATGADTRVSFSNCSFSNLATALVVQQGDVVLSGVTFDNVSTGLATEQTQLCECRDCDFTGIGEWAIDSDSLQTTVEQSTFAGKNGIRLGDRSTRLAALSALRVPVLDNALQISRRDAVISDVSVRGTGYGIFAENLDSLDVSQFSSEGCSEWGVFASGDGLTLTDSAIEDGTNGVCFNGGGDGQLATVANSTISGHQTYGLLLNRVSFDFETSRDLTIRRNGSFGLGVVGADLTLTNAAGFELSDNGYGIYSAQGDLDVSGLTLDGNAYGLSQAEGQFVCRDVTIIGSGTGLQHINGTQLVVERTTVSGARDWGIHLQSDEDAASPTVELREVALKDGANGVYAKLPARALLTLSDSELSGNSGYGLLSSGVSTQLQRVSISGNQTGLQHSDGPLTIEDSVVSRNRGVGISVAGVNASALTTLTARRNQLTGNQRGISAWNVNAAALLNNVLRGNSYGLLTQTIAGQADVWNNTLVDNQIGIHHGAGIATVRNNLVVYGDGTATVPNTVGIDNSRQGTLTHGSNLLSGHATPYLGTAPGVGDVLKPPRFVDYAQGDFRLAKGSPAINAGTSTGGLITRDLVGTQRPMFDAFEIGAYEYSEKDGSVRIVQWNEQAEAP